MITGHIFGTHTRQDVFAGAQTDEKGERDQPYTQSKVGGNLGKGGNVIHMGLVRLAPRARAGGERRREMAKPEPVVETDEETGEDEDRIRQFDKGEAAQVARVDQMGDDGEKG